MRRWLLGILALIGTVLLGTAPVLGAMDTAFILEAKTPEEQMRIAENLDVCLTGAFESRGQIACFSVREDGWGVIGDNSTDPGRISVLSPDSAFVRGYTFDLDGAYSLGWSGEDILVYSVLVIVAAFGLGIAYRITHPAKRKRTGKPGGKMV